MAKMCLLFHFVGFHDRKESAAAIAANNKDNNNNKVRQWPDDRPTGWTQGPHNYYLSRGP